MIHNTLHRIVQQALQTVIARKTEDIGAVRQLRRRGAFLPEGLVIAHRGSSIRGGGEGRRGVAGWELVVLQDRAQAAVAAVHAVGVELGAQFTVLVQEVVDVLDSFLQDLRLV